MDYYGLISSYLSADILFKIIRIAFIILVGLFLVGLATRLVNRIKADFFSEHIRFLVVRGTWYAGVTLLVITLLSEFGFHVGTILGAAGIAGAAIGFASQTSLSNIISGLFLLTERSFSVGDVITVSSVTGTVVGIGLLSVKLRQNDGTFVRIPNEQVIKNSLVNLSFFNQRRFDFRVTVAYKEDLTHVVELLQSIVKANKYSVQDKDPMILCDDFKESGVSIFVGVWGRKDTFTDLKKTILVEIKKGFEAEGIEMPFPQLVVSMKESKV